MLILPNHVSLLDGPPLRAILPVDGSFRYLLPHSAGVVVAFMAP
jgi:hypothetical protein